MNKFGNKYKKTDKVRELDGIKDFNDLKVKNCNGFGLLKIYAPWCPHCTDMVDDMNFLAEQLEQENINICALNSDNPNNKGICSKLGVTGIPSLMMIKQNGELEEINELLKGQRTVENILNIMCNKTQEYVNHSDGAKCCRTVVKNNKRTIECNK